MRHLFLVLTLFVASLTGALQAQTNATLVELYTSQGCSSCPPADSMMQQLAARDDVIALALHVDYWDYLGWTDDMADPSYTRRQQNYARRAGSATVYTPQMVIGGVDHVVGSKPMQVMDRIQAHNVAPDPVALRLELRGDVLTIHANAVRGTARKDTVVQLVRYAPLISRDIRRGENAGRTIDYANVVTSWQVAGHWNTAAPLEMQARVTGDAPLVVIVQDGTDGPVLAAAQLR